jgi:hypothetical protein
MTKQQELDILQDAITKLGPDSYLGPWLADVKAEVAMLITGDCLPDISLKDAAMRAKGIVELAEEAAKQIKAGSERQAKQANATLARDLEITARQVTAAREALTQVANIMTALHVQATLGSK